MSALLQETSEEVAPLQLVERALGVCPLRAVRQSLSESGKAVYRVDLPEGKSVALRTSDRPHTFAFTKRNLDALRTLGLPVQSVIAQGRTETGGSYIILNWIPGRDLVHILGGISYAQMTRLAEQVVECQRRLGRLPQGARFGWAPIGRSGNLQRWSEVFGEAATASMVDDGTPLGKLRARLCTLRTRVEPYFELVKPTPFLDDLTTKNVLVENGELSGIIDVDFVCYGDPLLAVGATMASLAADVPEAGAFYGEELIRCWNPSAEQRLAIWFYAALWGVGILQMTNCAPNALRARLLSPAVDSWLRAAQEQP
jgi:aminoglycoside phosphotransferase (APT) family kinase protein